MFREKALGIWPNPVSPRANIYYDLEFAMGARVDVYELNGRLFSSLALQNNRDSMEWDMGALLPSTYVLVLVNNGRAVASEYVVKN